MNTIKNETKVYTFRIPVKTLDAMREMAAKNKRSIAKEIELAVDQYLERNN